VAEFGFPRKSRLLNAADYKTVFDNNQYKVSCRYFLMLAHQTFDSRRRLGLVVAKKNVAKAVPRNRIKRQIRESFRKASANRQAADVIVLVRKDVDRLTNLQVAEKLNSLWQDLEIKLEGTNNFSLAQAGNK